MAVRESRSQSLEEFIDEKQLTLVVADLFERIAQKVRDSYHNKRRTRVRADTICKLLVKCLTQRGPLPSKKRILLSSKIIFERPDSVISRVRGNEHSGNISTVTRSIFEELTTTFFNHKLQPQYIIQFLFITMDTNIRRGKKLRRC